MQSLKEFSNKHPICSSFVIYLLFSLLSVLLDLLRKFDIASTDFWFIVKLCVLSVISILFMIAFGFFSKKSEFESKQYKSTLVPIIVFITAKIAFIVFALCNSTRHNLGLYNMFYNFLWALGIGVSEEVLCRGLLLNVIKNGEYKVQKSPVFIVLVSSLIFSLGHISNVFYGSTLSSVLVQSISSFIMGAYFAVLYLYSESILLVISLHTLYDFVGFTINDISFTSTSALSAVYFLLNCVCLLILGVVVLINIYRLRKGYL